MGTVRIADDVNKAYKKLAGAEKGGPSVTARIDLALRRDLGLAMPDGSPVPGTPERTPARTKTAPKPAAAQVKKGAGKDRTAAKSAPTGPCTVHPPGRIIDGVCMACGGQA